MLGLCIFSLLIHIVFPTRTKFSKSKSLQITNGALFDRKNCFSKIASLLSLIYNSIYVRMRERGGRVRGNERERRSIQHEGHDRQRGILFQTYIRRHMVDGFFLSSKKSLEKVFRIFLCCLGTQKFIKAFAFERQFVMN